MRKFSAATHTFITFFSCTFTITQYSFHWCKFTFCYCNQSKDGLIKLLIFSKLLVGKYPLRGLFCRELNNLYKYVKKKLGHRWKNENIYFRRWSKFYMQNIHINYRYGFFLNIEHKKYWKAFWLEILKRNSILKLLWNF